MRDNSCIQSSLYHNEVGYVSSLTYQSAELTVIPIQEQAQVV